jgi:CRP-like cAMP-binding protein
MNASKGMKTDLDNPLLRVLRWAAPFRSLDEASTAKIAAHSHSRSFRRGAVIFRKDQAVEELIVVRSGRVKLFLASPKGQKLLLDIAQQGDILGDVGVLDGRTHSIDAVALEPTEVIVVERDAVIEAAKHHPSVTSGIVEALSRRVRRTTEILEGTLFFDASTRLLQNLERLAQAYGEQHARGLRINHRLSQEMLGQAIGVSRETVNKQLNEWREQGLLEVGRGFVVLHDLARLQTIVREQERARSYSKPKLDVGETSARETDSSLNGHVGLEPEASNPR